MQTLHEDGYTNDTLPRIDQEPNCFAVSSGTLIFG